MRAERVQMEVRMQEEMRTGKEGGRGRGKKGEEGVSLVPESEPDLPSAKGSFQMRLCHFPDDFKQEGIAAFHICRRSHLQQEDENYFEKHT